MLDQHIIQAIDYLCCHDILDDNPSNCILDLAIAFSGGSPIEDEMEVAL